MLVGIILRKDLLKLLHKKTDFKSSSEVDERSRRNAVRYVITIQAIQGLGLRVQRNRTLELRLEGQDLWPLDSRRASKVLVFYRVQC